MKKQLIAALALATLTALPVLAGDSSPAPAPKYDPKDMKQSIMDQNTQVDYFRAHEFSVDLFGLASAPLDGTINGGFGGGGGVNYFFTKYFGVGIEGGAFEGGGTADTVTSVTGDLIARYPIESLHLAPYAFIGGGWHWASENIDGAIGEAGLGVEYRFTPHIGLFTDGRFVVADSANDYGLARVGIRYAF